MFSYVIFFYIAASQTPSSIDLRKFKVIPRTKKVVKHCLKLFLSAFYKALF